MKWQSFIIVVFIFGLSSRAIVSADVPEYLLKGQDQFDVTYYQLNLTVSPGEEAISGSVIVHAKSTVDGLNEIVLDLFNTMTISEITGNVKNYTHENDLIYILLDRTYNLDEYYAIEIFYSGKPEQVDIGNSGKFNPFLFVHYRKAETACAESCPYYARAWWPCKDTPSDKPDSVHLYITIPEGLDLAANGKFIDAVDNTNGTFTHHWQILNPIATYLLTIQITDYARFSETYVSSSGDSMEIMYFVFPEDCTKALSNLKKTRKMIDILSKYYGDYPYLNEKYGMVEYLGAWAAMEYQTLSCFNGSNITNEMTSLHELAHQWYGDCVSPKNFHHSWVSEGFAVLSEALYVEHNHGLKKYHQYMNNQNNALSYKERIYRDDISEPKLVYGHVIYYKGAWVLHMLRHILGDSTFFHAIREYRYRFEYSSATTEDLQAVCEDVSGLDLDYFFKQWIYDYWHPEYVYGWSSQKSGNNLYRVTGFIDQKQTSGSIFTMPVDITIETSSGETTFVKFTDEQGELFDFTVNGEPQKVTIDKDGWILKEVTEIKAPVVAYVDYLIDDSAGNGNARPDPGESVRMVVVLTNTGLNLANATGTLSTEDPDISIQSAQGAFGSIGHRFQVNNENQPFVFSVSPSTPGHLAIFQLTITGDDHYSTELSFEVKVSKARTLFIDDDEGASYNQYYSRMFSEFSIYADTWDVNAQTPAIAQLSDYATIIWATGDSRDNALTETDIDSLIRFLDNGGKLLLTGQNIGYDLIGNGSLHDSLFYADYLHAEYLADSSVGVAAFGRGGPIASGLYAMFDGEAGAHNQDSPDEIAPIDPAVEFMMYLPGNKSAAICYVDETKAYRSAYFAFGLEGVAGPQKNSGGKILASAMEWLNGAAEVDDFQKKIELPESFSISQNYPNPFNPETMINYQLPEPCHVSLSVFNALGQQVINLVDEKKPAGFHYIEWSGNDVSGLPVASGIYFLKFQAEQHIEMKKMVVVR